MGSGGYRKRRMADVVVTKIRRHLDDFELSDKDIDWLELEWEELNKRILRKSTTRGVDIAIRLEEGQALHYGDVLYEEDDTLIAIRTKREKAFVIKPKTMREMGEIAFKIGNRHTPCIIEDEGILIRYDHTLQELIDEVGVAYEQSERRFKTPLKYKGHQH
jgi:urease accessory protein